MSSFLLALAAVLPAWVQWALDRFWPLFGGAFLLGYGTWAGLWPEALLRSVATGRRVKIDEWDPTSHGIVRFISVGLVTAGLCLLMIAATT